MMNDVADNDIFIASLGVAEELVLLLVCFK